MQISICLAEFALSSHQALLQLMEMLRVVNEILVQLFDRVRENADANIHLRYPPSIEYRRLERHSLLRLK